MRESKLAWGMATACLLASCATGVDSQDGLTSGDDSGIAAEASLGQDAAGSGGQDSAATEDSGSTAPDAGSSGDDGSPTNDSSSSGEAAATEDSATVQDTGAAPDTSTGQDTGTTGGGICPSTAQYAFEAAAEVTSGKLTFCLTGVCSASECCYEQLSPGNLCVAK